MEQGKINLTTLAVIMASSISLIGNQEFISPGIMSYVKTVTRDYFASNVENVQVKPISGGYSAAENVQIVIADKRYVLWVISELESPLRINTELYAMKEAGAAGIEFDLLNGFKELSKQNKSYGVFDHQIGFTTLDGLTDDIRDKWQQFIEINASRKI